MSFLYFLPGTDATLDAIRAAGLAYALDGGCTTRTCTKGPGDQAGILLTPRGATVETGYFPDRQTWQPIPGSVAHIGHYTDRAMPAPEELERPERINKVHNIYRLPLGDGRVWTLPGVIVPHTPDGGEPVRRCLLPKVRKQRPDGTIEKRTKGEWEPLYLLADEVCDALENGLDLEEDRAVEIALAALASNYRISATEASILEILDDESMLAIIGSMVNLQEWTVEKE